MRRSPNYLFSVNHNSPRGAEELLRVRSAVKFLNAQARASGSPSRVRVVTSPRWNKRDSKYAWKYWPNTKDRRWKREDADHLDVYVVPDR